MIANGRPWILSFIFPREGPRGPHHVRSGQAGPDSGVLRSGDVANSPTQQRVGDFKRPAVGLSLV
jgi:hypothetical protein